MSGAACFCANVQYDSLKIALQWHFSTILALQSSLFYINVNNNVIGSFFSDVLSFTCIVEER